jgi:hypothetical protein
MFDGYLRQSPSFFHGKITMLDHFSWLNHVKSPFWIPSEPLRSQKKSLPVLVLAFLLSDLQPVEHRLKMLV